MIEALLDLPAHLRRRLAGALETGLVAPPYADAQLTSALDGSVDSAALREALQHLAQRGITGRAQAGFLALLDEHRSRERKPDLVWSGPRSSGLHARETPQVFEELLSTAQRSLWISSYVVYNGSKSFGAFARRMDEVPTLEVKLLLNIERPFRDATPSDELVRRFADRLWGQEWPGSRRPRVYYDPRALDPEGPRSVLHAKAVVADEERLFVTSANLTEAAWERNIELGVLLQDRAMGLAVIRHLQGLIDQERMHALPS